MSVADDALEMCVALFYARREEAKRTETCTACEGSGRAWQVPGRTLVIRCAPCEGRGRVIPAASTGELAGG